MAGRRMIDGRYGKTYADKLTKEFLTEEYSNKRLSPYQIAADVGCSPKIVYDYIDFHNLPRIDFSGKITAGLSFGWLTTVSVHEQRTYNGSIQWLCKCKCGKETLVPTARLKNGGSKSCGCYRNRKKNHLWKGYCDVSGNMVCEIRCRARKKKFAFELDAKFLWELFIQQDCKCAISNVPIKLDANASLDRTDSNGGYTKDNVQWVHQDVNKMKMDLPLDKFLSWCEIITNNRKEV